MSAQTEIRWDPCSSPRHPGTPCAVATLGECGKCQAHVVSGRHTWTVDISSGHRIVATPNLEVNSLTEGREFATIEEAAVFAETQLARAHLMFQEAWAARERRRLDVELFLTERRRGR